MNEGVRRVGDTYLVPMPGPGGPLELQLESRLYMTEAGFGSGPSLYPVTIVQARYVGTYEGAAWLAFPVAPRRLAEPGWRDWGGSGVECNDWHIRAREASWPVGRGGGPGGAYADLLSQVAAAAGVTLEDLTTAPEWPTPQAEGGGGGAESGGEG